MYGEWFVDMKSTFRKLREVIYPIVLTKMPHDFVSQCVENYNENTEDEIDFGDDSYKTFYTHGKIGGEGSNQTMVVMEIVGKSFTEESLYNLRWPKNIP